VIKVLFFISNAPQFLKAFSKNFRTIISIAVLQKIGVFFISTMIFFPSFVEADPIVESQVDPVFMNGSFVFEVLPFEFLPMSGNQTTLQAIEKMVFAEGCYALNAYNGTEFGRHLNESFTSFSSTGKSVVEDLIDQGDYDPSDDREDDRINTFFFGTEIDNPFNHEPWEYPLFCLLWSSFWCILIPIILGANDKLTCRKGTQRLQQAP